MFAPVGVWEMGYSVNLNLNADLPAIFLRQLLLGNPCPLL